MIYHIVFVILSSASFQGGTTAAVSNGRDFSVENSDFDGNLARVNRGAFTDWFLANKGVSEDNTDEVDSLVVSNSVLTKWCEWFGKRSNGSTAMSNTSLCKTYRDYVMHMRTVTTQPPLVNSVTSTAPTNNAKFVDFENHMNVSHTRGSRPRSRQTVIIVRRIVEEYNRKKRNDDEKETESASGEDKSELKPIVSSKDDKISKSSSSESAQDTSSVERSHGKPYFFVR